MNVPTTARSMEDELALATPLELLREIVEALPEPSDSYPGYFQDALTDYAFTPNAVRLEVAVRAARAALGTD